MNVSPIALIGAGLLILTVPAEAGETRTYDLSVFDRIDVSAGIKLVAEVGGKQSVEVETDNGDFEDFEIDVKGRRLKISRKWNRLAWHGNRSEYKVKVSLRDLQAIEASSGSHSKISNIDARKFLIDISSGADVYVEGNCEECTVDISSGAGLDARELECDTANIDVSSGGHGKMNVSHSVVADASSGGYVVVYGSPERVNIDKSSGGKIKIKSSAQAKHD